MKQHIAFIVLALFAICLVSCSENDSGIERWGEIKSFPDWFLNKYKPQTITRTLNVEFNEDAKVDFQRDIVLALYQVNDQGRELAVKPEQVKVFVNGAETPDNKIRIGKDDSQLEIGLQVQKEFLKESGPGMFNWKFKVLDNGGLDYINEFEVSGSDETPLLEDNTAMDVYHERGKNVPRVITDTSLGTIFLAFLAIVTLIQIIVPKFTDNQIKKQFITVDGSRRGMPNMNKKAKGSAKIVLTGKKGLKQGFFHMLFHGRTSFVFIKGLTSDISLTPGKRFQTLAAFDRHEFTSAKAGDREELKVIRGETKDNTPVEVEFYALKK